uniref:Lipoma preferred partner n=1 Tax=Echinococcus granulosus TaxID=6210 RepID=A0A068WMA7_ECHGR|nr:lipoma preferred partner [Echinococcus granulosus]
MLGGICSTDVQQGLGGYWDGSEVRLSGKCEMAELPNVFISGATLDRPSTSAITTGSRHTQALPDRLYSVLVAEAAAIAQMGDRFYGRRLSTLSSEFNERAAPRTTDGRKYHHAVKPAPLYAQLSELYPMRAHSGSPGDFRYHPTADIKMPGSGLTAHSQGRIGGGVSGGGVSIPVLHLDSPDYYTGRSGVYTGRLSGNSGGSYRTGGVLRKSSPTITSPTSFPTDPEAEVDALTDALMQKMETPRSGAIMSPHESAADGTSSPAGSIRRGSGGATLLPSRVTRLQQQAQQRVGSPITVSNNNSGSPLTVGSPRTSSPTNSSASSGATDSYLQNNCFRCRRPLIPPESATLGPGTPTPPVVTLTGALAVRLHEACFTCYICRTKLNPQGYYHSLHRLLCPTCVRDGAVESCKNCRRPIGERIVRALGAPYHPACFVCSVCHTHLDSKPFTVDVHGRPLCLDDFHKRFAPRCTACNRPIVPEAGSHEARRVVVGDSNYHLLCCGVKTADSSASTPTPSMATA